MIISVFDRACERAADTVAWFCSLSAEDFFLYAISVAVCTAFTMIFVGGAALALRLVTGWPVTGAGVFLVSLVLGAFGARAMSGR